MASSTEFIDFVCSQIAEGRMTEAGLKVMPKKMEIDTTNMCSHLQAKLLYQSGVEGVNIGSEMKNGDFSWLHTLKQLLVGVDKSEL